MAHTHRGVFILNNAAALYPLHQLPKIFQQISKTSPVQCPVLIPAGIRAGTKWERLGAVAAKSHALGKTNTGNLEAEFSPASQRSSVSVTLWPSFTRAKKQNK